MYSLIDDLQLPDLETEDSQEHGLDYWKLEDFADLLPNHLESIYA